MTNGLVVWLFFGWLSGRSGIQVLLPHYKREKRMFSIESMAND